MFDLVSELKNYKPYDAKEKQHYDKIVEFLTNGDNCFDRSNTKGHITAGALVVDRKGNILLNHHKASGMWFQFGGHSDGEKDSLSVAKREVMEEANITKFVVIPNTILDVAVQKIPYSKKKNEPEHYHYDVNFMFVVDDHNFKLSSESVEIKWVSIAEAKKLIADFDDGMQRMISKYEDCLNLKILD